MKKIVFALLTVALLAGCHKDKYKTEPTVEIRSIGPSEVNLNETFTLTATVTDDEGDALDSVIIVQKMYSFTTGTLLSVDSSATSGFRNSIANFGVPSGTRKFDLSILFSYNRQTTNAVYIRSVPQKRKVSYGLIMIDKDKHRNTLGESEQIVLNP